MKENIEEMKKKNFQFQGVRSLMESRYELQADPKSDEVDKSQEVDSSESLKVSIGTRTNN